MGVVVCARRGRRLALLETLELRRLLASGPIVITQGGTYTGNWENLANDSPVVTVKTTQPVVILNSTIRGKGHLIFSNFVGTNITVRNTSGYGVNPNIYGESPGRFVKVENGKNLVVQDNYLEGTAGIHVLGYDGNRTTSQTIKVIGNRAKNIDGRKSNGAGGWIDFNERRNLTTGVRQSGYDYAQFLQLDKVYFVPGIQIAWNEIVNEVGKSRVEDVISIYKSSGIESSPIKIHDNYIEGAYTIKPWQTTYSSGGWQYNWSYSGGGIMVGDGFGDTINGDPAWVRAFGNTVINTTNYGIAAAAGHDTEIYLNRIFSSGKLPDGRPSAQQNVGIYIWDSYDLGSSRFNDNVAYSNTVGWLKSDGTRNDWRSPHSGVFDANVHDARAINRQLELAEAAAWRLRRYPPPPGSIAGTIFKDIDGDGARDANDPGIAGVYAWLDYDGDNIRDRNEPVSRSSSTGRYTFNSLGPGKYIVRVIPNSGWRVSSASFAVLNVASGKTVTRHFGVSTTTLVSGTVYRDLNGNGGIDAGESGLSGWRVYADADKDGHFDSGETFAVTNASGRFGFIGLAASTHHLRVIGQPGFSLTAPGSGYRSVTLSSGQIVTSRNFGQRPV